MTDVAAPLIVSQNLRNAPAIGLSLAAELSLHRLGAVELFAAGGRV